MVTRGPAAVVVSLRSCYHVPRYAYVDKLLSDVSVRIIRYQSHRLGPVATESVCIYTSVLIYVCIIITPLGLEFSDS